jgi:hypothetical protein
MGLGLWRGNAEPALVSAGAPHRRSRVASSWWGHRGAEGAELGAVLRQVIHVGLLALESQPVGLGRPTGLAPPRPLRSSPPSWGRSAWGRCGEGCAVSVDV